MLLHRTQFHTRLSIPDFKRRNHLNYISILIYLSKDKTYSLQDFGMLDSFGWLDYGGYCQPSYGELISWRNVVYVNWICTHIYRPFQQWPSFRLRIAPDRQILSQTSADCWHGGFFWSLNLFGLHSNAQFHSLLARNPNLCFIVIREGSGVKFWHISWWSNKQRPNLKWSDNSDNLHVRLQFTRSHYC